MEKVISLLLALVMLFSMTAFATESGAGDHSTDVIGTYVEGDDISPIIYSVDITWDELSFTYYEESAATWDPVTHEYKTDARAAGWDENDIAEVEIVNHSNTCIIASFSYQANPGYSSASMNFDFRDLYLISAEDGTKKTASNKVTPSGTLPEGTENAVIGAITVKIEKCPDVSLDLLQDTFRNFENILGASYNNAVEDEEVDALRSGTRYITKSDIDAFMPTYDTLTKTELYLKYYYLSSNFTPNDNEQKEMNEQYCKIITAQNQFYKLYKVKT